MDPITMMMGAMQIGGMGLSLLGTSDATRAAQQISQDSQAIGGLDIQVNSQRQQQMQLQTNRAQLQNVRNAQMARSQALSGSVNQGANVGSGIAGGLASISGKESTNALASSQNLQIGQNIFGLDSQIDQYRMNMASMQGQQASAQGMMALGGDITKSAGPLSNIFGKAFQGGSGSTPTPPSDFNWA